MFSLFSYYIWGETPNEKNRIEDLPKIPDSNKNLDTLRVGNYDEHLVKMRESLRKSTN